MPLTQVHCTCIAIIYISHRLPRSCYISDMHGCCAQARTTTGARTGLCRSIQIRQPCSQHLRSRSTRSTPPAPAPTQPAAPSGPACTGDAQQPFLPWWRLPLQASLGSALLPRPVRQSLDVSRAKHEVKLGGFSHNGRQLRHHIVGQFQGVTDMTDICCAGPWRAAAASAWCAPAAAAATRHLSNRSSSSSPACSACSLGSWGPLRATAETGSGSSRCPLGCTCPTAT